MPDENSRIRSFIEHLACPICGGDFHLETSSLTCYACSKKFPVIRGIPRFVASDSYAKSFSWEWLLNQETQLAKRIGEAYQVFDFEMRSGLKVNKPPGVTLEGGCGAGRHSDLLARNGWKIISVDLSMSVESAYKNLKGYEDVLVIQADLNSLPLKRDSIDAIFSLGVIHHTPSPRQSFASLRRHLRPGGTMSVSVYSNEGMLTRLQNKIGDLYRFTVKGIPPEMLYEVVDKCSKVFRLPSALYRDPLHFAIERFVKGERNKLTLPNVLSMLVPPLAFLPDQQWRVLNTFDYLSPRHASKHTYSEVLTWFEQEGFRETKPLPVPVSVIGML